MVHRAVHSRCSVNSAYLFSTLWSSIIRAYDLPKIVSHNSPAGTFYPSLVGLSIPDILPFHSCCWAFAHAASPSWDAISQISTIPILAHLSKPAEAPSPMQLAVPISSPKRPSPSLSGSNTWVEAPILALDHSVPQPSCGPFAAYMWISVSTNGWEGFREPGNI